MTAGAMLRAAGEAFETARRMGASPGEAMDLALRELASCRQRNRNQGVGGKPAPLSVPARAVVDAVLKAHGLTVDDARKARLTKHDARIRRARDEAVYVCRALYPDAGYEALAALFDRDHSSLISGQRVLSKRLASDEVLALRLRRLLEAPRAEEGVGAAAGGAA